MRAAKNKIVASMAVMLLFLVTTPAATAESGRLDLGGQAITGHEVVEIWSGQRLRKVKVSTADSVPGGNFWAVISNDILD